MISKEIREDIKKLVKKLRSDPEFDRLVITKDYIDMETTIKT